MADGSQESDWLSLALRTPSRSPGKSSPISPIYSQKSSLADIFPKSTVQHAAFPFTSFAPSKFSKKATHTSSYNPSSPTLLSTSRKDSGSSGSYSGPSSYDSSYPASYDNLIDSLAQLPTDSHAHLQMIASPSPLHSQQTTTSFVISPPKLSPITPNIFFTPSVSPRNAYTPGTSPIEHSPKPCRRVVTMERNLELPAIARRFESEELDGDFDDTFFSTDEEDEETHDLDPTVCDLMAKFVQSDEEDEERPASPTKPVFLPSHAPLTNGSTPFTPRAISGPPSKSAFSSPLSSCSPSGSEGSVCEVAHRPPKIMRKLTQLPGRVVSGRTYHISPEQILVRDNPAVPRQHFRKRKLAFPKAPALPTKRPSKRISPSPIPPKKRRISNSSENSIDVSKTASNSSPRVVTATDPATLSYPQRTFPPNVSINPSFALFYRQFPISSFVAQDGKTPSLPSQQGSVNYNPPRSVLDLYTPRFTRGIGRTKVGTCPICAEKPSRGGESRFKWLSMKFSAFKCYHMQYAHGISPTTGRPFSPPTGFRTTARPKAGKRERTEMVEGRCHKCKKWVPLESVKEGDAKVMELFWWKHAATCHQGSTIEGEGDVYVVDDVHRNLTTDL